MNPYLFYSVCVARSQKFPPTEEEKTHLIMKVQALLFWKHRENAYMLMTKNISKSVTLFSIKDKKQCHLQNPWSPPTNRHYI